MLNNILLFVGSDHRGYFLKNEIVKRLKAKGYSVTDKSGVNLNLEDDYPVFAGKVVNEVLANGDDARGILFCGSGQGMAMTANRRRGIRAAVVWDKTQAKLARNDDDSNVLAIPADLFEKNIEGAMDIIETWLKTPFESLPRRIRRIKQMDDL